MSNDFRFVVFGPEDAQRLARFNKEVRNGLADPAALEIRDEDYYARYTGKEGWTIGFEAPSGIVATHHLTWLLEPYRARWVFPTEATLMRSPALWWGGFAVHPDFQRHGIGAKLLSRGERFAKDQGYDGLVGAYHPSGLRLYLGAIRRDERVVVGIYYDDDGWNILHVPRESCVSNCLPSAVGLWVDAQSEKDMRAAIEDGMVGIAASESDPPRIGFGRPLSKR